MKNTLALIRKKKGHGNIRKFINEEIGVSYRTFVHQCETGTVQYKHIKVLMNLTGIKFEDFKDYEYKENHEAKTKKEKQEHRKSSKIKKSIDTLNIPEPIKLSSIFGLK